MHRVLSGMLLSRTACLPHGSASATLSFRDTSTLVIVARIQAELPIATACPCPRDYRPGCAYLGDRSCILHVMLSMAPKALS